MKKNEKTEYYLRAQRRKSLKYNDKQRYQDYITIPTQLFEELKLRPGQIMKCMRTGNSLLYTPVAEKPKQSENKNGMKYEEWANRIRTLTPIGTWKECNQILKEASAKNPPPPTWVILAKNEIGLKQKLNLKTRRTLWSLDPQKVRSTSKPALRDTNLTDIITQSSKEGRCKNNV